jgi:DNA repair protein RecO (recombination protein O)
MSIEKTTHLVLSVMPYRESSAIATLLSQRFGRVSGIAKGVRRTPLAPLTLERGLLVELVLYVRPHRDLHTIGAISVVNYFPSIRTDLGKLAARDAAFELMLKSVAASETHGELFDFAVATLERLEALPGHPFPAHELWGFYFGWSKLLGFLPNVERCVMCGSPRVAQEGGQLVPEKGGLVCLACGNGGGRQLSFLPGAVVAFLIENALLPVLPLREQLRICRLLADYCRYHLDIRGELKALAFLESVLSEQETH